jgi:hypothetical protein
VKVVLLAVEELDNNATLGFSMGGASKNSPFSLSLKASCATIQPGAMR